MKIGYLIIYFVGVHYVRHLFDCFETPIGNLFAKHPPSAKKWIAHDTTLCLFSMHRE